jgi:26S proteasome regulatory subunit N12
MAQQSLGPLFNELKKAFRAEELEQCGVILAKLKVCTSPGSCCGTDNQYAGEILEVGAFWSIRSEDIPSFDRYYSQLQTFYDDYR